MEKRQEENIKKIRVHILASSHPQFDEILDFPPDGVEYNINRVKTAYHGWVTQKKVALHGKLMAIFPIPRMTHTKTDADLVHSTRGILQIKQKKPWIIDLESGGIFVSFRYAALRNPIMKRIIINALKSKGCKRILPQSEAAKKNLMKVIDCHTFADKIEVLYLCMRPCNKKKIERKDKKVVLSYVGRGFMGKGGHDLLKAYEILTQKYDNLELKFKGDIPEEYLPLAEKLKSKGLKVIEGHFPREELFDRMYLSSDIFVLPTHQDNYGVVFLEAMSAGLPIVGTENFTVPELIEDGKNGFLIKSPYSWENYLDENNKLDTERMLIDWKKPHPGIIKQLVDKISILVEDKKLREKMGRESRKMIEDENGKFSIIRRNKQLRKIYEESLGMQ
ncbi:MAG: glycosyltransferase family 4 protein [Candidatus Nanoarchaeia archaeon]|nr:glycosyltransferase family 4 protein [Candidatus Nanoarchaeia archaeon]